MKFLKKNAPVFAVLLLITLTGCKSSFWPAGSEITSYEIIRVLGIDKSGGGNDVEVTMIAERAKPSPGEEGGGMAYEIMSATGKTAFEAVSRLRARTDKKQVFGYVDYIVFGEETADEDFAEYADFPARNPEIRYSPKVFLTRGGTAKELLTTTSTGDKYIGDSLDNLSRNISARSDFSLLRNIELMNMLDKSGFAAVIPAVSAVPPDEGKLIEGELPERKLTAAGYAVLRDRKLIGYLEKTNARAYNLLTGMARNCAYSVTDSSGAFAGLDTISSGVTVLPHWDGNTLKGVTFKVEVDAGIAEQRSLTDLDTAPALEGLARELESAIERELYGAVMISQDYGIDCLKLGQRLKMKNPYRWRALETNWRELYKNLEIDVKAEAVVRRTYDIREPSGFSGGGL